MFCSFENKAQAAPFINLLKNISSNELSRDLQQKWDTIRTTSVTSLWQQLNNLPQIWGKQQPQHTDRLMTFFLLVLSRSSVACWQQCRLPHHQTPAKECVSPPPLQGSCGPRKARWIASQAAHAATHSVQQRWGWYPTKVLCPCKVKNMSPFLWRPSHKPPPGRFPHSQFYAFLVGESLVMVCQSRREIKRTWKIKWQQRILTLNEVMCGWVRSTDYSPIIRQRVTGVQVLVQELCGLRRVSNRCAEFSIRCQKVLLQTCLTAWLPSQSGEQSPTRYGNMCRHVGRHFLLSVLKQSRPFFVTLVSAQVEKQKQTKKTTKKIWLFIKSKGIYHRITGTWHRNTPKIQF